MKPSATLPTAIVLGGVILAGAIYFSMGGQWPSFASRSGDPARVRPVDASDHILGNPTAPVVIIEYADFDCEYCKDFSSSLNQIIANAGAKGRVAWVYREFPLSEMHPNALAGARAAECAARVGGNDAFWAFADLLFNNQPANPSSYGALAKQAGVQNSDAFATCYADAANQVDARISADRKNALLAGASGTPYSLLLVNGKVTQVIDSAYSYDALNQLVTEALASAH
ncbi:MAG: thioredoxin domain-containing protein [bacterium]|nr:thioredoxin domain-containing protein [bacterium]